MERKCRGQNPPMGQNPPQEKNALKYCKSSS